METEEEERYRPATTGDAQIHGAALRSWAVAERGRRLEAGQARGLDRRAESARGWWRRGGGRKQAERLRGEEVAEGRMGDSHGRWALEAIVEVRRPAKRRGMQLKALLRWRGVNPASGVVWAEEWKPVTQHYLTEDMRMKARRMEAARYGKRAAVQRLEGERRSARLQPAGAAEAGGAATSGAGAGAAAGAGTAGGTATALVATAAAAAAAAATAAAAAAATTAGRRPST